MPLDDSYPRLHRQYAMERIHTSSSAAGAPALFAKNPNGLH